MIKRLFTQWTPMRWVRLVLSIIILGQAILSGDRVLGFAGTALLILAIANVGCCCGVSCSTASYKKENIRKSDQPVTYEEVV